MKVGRWWYNQDSERGALSFGMAMGYMIGAGFYHFGGWPLVISSAVVSLCMAFWRLWRGAKVAADTPDIALYVSRAMKEAERRGMTH